MLEDIKKNIEKMVALYEGEREARKNLESELEGSKALCETYKKQIAELQREVDNLKLTEAFTAPEGGNPAAKEKIEKLIREIDKCIDLLER